MDWDVAEHECSTVVRYWGLMWGLMDVYMCMWCWAKSGKRRFG